MHKILTVILSLLISMPAYASAETYPFELEEEPRKREIITGKSDGIDHHHRPVINEYNNPIVLKDKQNRAYKLREFNLARRGHIMLSYYLNSEEKGNKISIYNSSAFGADWECMPTPPPPALEFLKISARPIKQQYQIYDVNDDKYDDLVFFAEEENCTTKERAVLKKIFYSTENGFSEK
jgi:hypothetical protein